MHYTVILNSSTSDHLYHFCGSDKVGDPLSMKEDWTSFDLIKTPVCEDRLIEIKSFLDIDGETEYDYEIQEMPEHQADLFMDELFKI